MNQTSTDLRTVFESSNSLLLMDPNWFYSSLAQSAAAIVGLLGAILLARLQQQSSEVQEAQRRLAEQTEEARQAARQLFDYVHQYRNYVSERVRRMAEAVANSQQQVAVNQLQTTADGSFITLSVEVPVSEETLRNERSQEEAAIRLVEVIPAAGNLDDPKEVSRFLQMLGAAMNVLPAEQAQMAYQILAPLGRVRQRLEDVKSRSHTGSSQIVLLVLSALCVVGVVLPLSYLSALQGASKVVLLGLFTSILLVLLMVLEFLILGVARAGKVDSLKSVLREAGYRV